MGVKQFFAKNVIISNRMCDAIHGKRIGLNEFEEIRVFSIAEETNFFKNVKRFLIISREADCDLFFSRIDENVSRETLLQGALQELPLIEIEEMKGAGYCASWYLSMFQ